MHVVNRLLLWLQYQSSDFSEKLQESTDGTPSPTISPAVDAVPPEMVNEVDASDLKPDPLAESPDPYPLITPTKDAASANTHEEDGPVYSSVEPQPQSDSLHPNSSATISEPGITAPDEGPVYSTVTPTGGKTPQLNGNITAAAALAVPNAVDEALYSSIVVTAPPREKKGKRKGKKAKLPAFIVKQPPNPNPKAGATSSQVEDNDLYSVVSNVPKQVGAQKLNRAAEENPDYAALNSVSLYGTYIRLFVWFTDPLNFHWGYNCFCYTMVQL